MWEWGEEVLRGEKHEKFRRIFHKTPFPWFAEYKFGL
jgi:hypothetical protein